MAKQETGITDTGESTNPLNRKVRRDAAGAGGADAQSMMGDGIYAQHGLRSAATNMGRPAMTPMQRRRKGMR